MAFSGSSLAFARGINSEFFGTYKPVMQGVLQRGLGEIMDLNFTSDGAAEDYFYRLSRPHPSRVNDGDIVPARGFGARAFRVVNFSYRLKVEWHINQERDDQTKTLVEDAQDAGQNFGILKERLFYQVIQATSDSELLPSIPLAGDGAALYSTTNGSGGARFGVTNGNLVSVADLSRPGNVRSAIFDGMERMSRFQDTEGQPFYPADYIMRQGIVVLFNVQNSELMQEAVRQSTTAHVAQNAAGSENIGVAGVTNVLAGYPVTLMPSSRLTGNSIYIFLKGARKKAVFSQVREPLSSNIATFANSDRAREAEIKALYWKERLGVGVCGEPLQTVKLVEA